MKNIVTFGEILMRLSPRESRKLEQVNSLDYSFGGTEMNVAASLFRLGLKVKHVSQISDDFLGESLIGVLKGYGIDTTYVIKAPFPLGLYFMESGTSLRGGRISYNRLHSSFANIDPYSFNWNEILKGCNHFHWTGITPGISEPAYQTLKESLHLAKQNNVRVSCDPTYRKNLWNYGKEGKEILLELVSLSNVFIGGVNEINEILGTQFPQTKNGFIDACQLLRERCPDVRKVFDKIRNEGNSSWQVVQGRCWNGNEYFETSPIEITHVLDRIGTGDAFAAGVIFGLEQQYDNDLEILEFATAAFAVKHTIIGDVNLSGKEEILEIRNGNLHGKINR